MRPNHGSSRGWRLETEVGLRTGRRRKTLRATFPGPRQSAWSSRTGAFGRRCGEAEQGGRIPGTVTKPAGQRAAPSGTVCDCTGRVAGPHNKRPSVNAVGRSLRTRFDGQHTKSWTVGRGAGSVQERAESIRQSRRVRRSGSRTLQKAAECERCRVESSDEVRRPTHEVVDGGARQSGHLCARGPSHFGRTSGCGQVGWTDLEGSGRA
jgi:hypothetical protein